MSMSLYVRAGQLDVPRRHTRGGLDAGVPTALSPGRRIRASAHKRLPARAFIGEAAEQPAGATASAPSTDDSSAAAEAVFASLSAARGLSGTRNTGLTVAVLAVVAFRDDAIADQRWLAQLRESRRVWGWWHRGAPV
jgi:hypothetical protein